MEIAVVRSSTEPQRIINIDEVKVNVISCHCEYDEYEHSNRSRECLKTETIQIYFELDNLKNVKKFELSCDMEEMNIKDKHLCRS